MTRKPVPRSGSRRLTAAVGCLLALGMAHAGAQAPQVDPKPQPVKNPYWGTALFEVYQDQPFTALTGLMASQHFGRVPLHADEAEVLRGGLLLDYGLHTAAGEIFTQLIERGAPPSVRDRAWFHLARLRYQKGLHAEAEAAMSRIGAALPRDMDDQRLLLLGQLQLARNDFGAAAATLSQLPPTSPQAPYAQFNLGVARIKAGETAAGEALLERLGTQPVMGEDLRSLRDRANLALGFAALQAGDAAAALKALERVRLEGPQSQAALLGFGWASLQQQEPRRALVAFRELAARSLRDAPVLEAQIAEPFAMAEAGAMGAALQGYEKAVETFARESAALDDGIARARNGSLIEQLIGLQTPQRMGVPVPLGVDAQLPQAGFLAPLLAQHELQEALKNLRDLRFAAGNLADWAGSLGIFDDMLAQRRQGFEQRAPQVQAQAGRLDLPAQRERLARLSAEVAQAAAAADGRAHANEKELALQARLQAAKPSLAGVDEADALPIRERLRLAEGALTWSLAREHHARQWSAQQAVSEVERGLGEAQQRSQALAEAQRDEPARLQQFAQRIAEIRTRLAGLAPRVAALSTEQQGQAQELAAAELGRQKERLAAYTAQARWAVAQLHDRARVAQASGDSDAKR